MSKPPTFLRNYQDLYEHDPREACRQWFREARYGLFMHFGLYSLLGRHEWVQYREKIRPAEYGVLAQWFKAGAFNAPAIADLAVESGMKYITITTRHHDSFCLWRTRETSFHVGNTPCNRDLIAELSVACQSRGLGLCLYYSHGRDWRHPHAPNNDEYGGAARPDYDPPEPTYAVTPAHDLNLYLDFMEAQIRELLTHYGPIAAIWLDGIATPRSGDWQSWRIQELYDLIHSLQDHVLVSYKDGLTGTEDFYAPEEHWGFEPKAGDDRPWEVCGCLSGGWGYTAGTEPRSADDVWKLLTGINGAGGNLLLNVGPLPDGSIAPEEAAVLREVGSRLRDESFPKAADAS